VKEAVGEEIFHGYGRKIEESTERNPAFGIF
jgi:hypothetical protein